MATTAVMKSKPNLNGALNNCAVFWHVWPYRTVIDREARQIGFELELIGSHCVDPNHLNPGCPQCRHVRSALLVVAEHLTNYVFPNLQQSLAYDIDSHSTSIVYSANRACVTVSIIVMHRQAFDHAIDLSDNFVLATVKQSMAELGIAER
jgi:hypothetical protein